MKDVLIPLGLLVAAIGVLYFVWAAPGTQAISPQPITAGSSITQPEAAKQVAAAKATHTAKQSGTKTPSAKAPESIVPDVVQASIAITPSLSPILTEEPALPLEAKVRPPVNTANVGVGMQAQRVIELLGNPDLRATRVRGGRLIETYVYTNTLDGDFVSIQLSGGRVVTAAQ